MKAAELRPGDLLRDLLMEEPGADDEPVLMLVVEPVGSHAWEDGNVTSMIPVLYLSGDQRGSTSSLYVDLDCSLEETAFELAFGADR